MFDCLRFSSNTLTPAGCFRKLDTVGPLRLLRSSWRTDAIGVQDAPK
jgi:hypothetical protein